MNTANNYIQTLRTKTSGVKQVNTYLTDKIKIFDL